jgi:hypothetical protein
MAITPVAQPSLTEDEEAVSDRSRPTDDELFENYCRIIQRLSKPHIEGHRSAPSLVSHVNELR